MSIWDKLTKTPVSDGALTVKTPTSTAVTPPHYAGILTHTHSSEWYEYMAEQAKKQERDAAMSKLADKLGLKSRQDVEDLIKELGL